MNRKTAFITRNQGRSRDGVRPLGPRTSLSERRADNETCAALRAGLNSKLSGSFVSAGTLRAEHPSAGSAGVVQFNPFKNEKIREMSSTRHQDEDTFNRPAASMG